MPEAKGIHRRLPINVTPNLIARFKAAVDEAGPDDCWNWTKSFRNGYGAIKHETRVLGAHRVAYVLAYGEPDEESLVTHSCDNRACCNPAHLKAGTPTDNVREKYDRGRQVNQRGSMAPGAVLNESQVVRIWLLRRTGQGAVKISRALGLTYDQVKRVLVGRTWQHLMPSWAKRQP